MLKEKKNREKQKGLRAQFKTLTDVIVILQSVCWFKSFMYVDEISYALSKEK